MNEQKAQLLCERLQYTIFCIYQPFLQFLFVKWVRMVFKRLLNPVILIETDELIRIGRNHFDKTKILNLRFLEISMKKWILFEKETALCYIINSFLYMIEFIGLQSLYLSTFYVALWYYSLKISKDRITLYLAILKVPFRK